MTISFPIEWKKRWGFIGASFLWYLQEGEGDQGDWFASSMKDFQEVIASGPQQIAVAREKLRADGVIEVERGSHGYQYRIDHERLAAIEAE